MALAGASEAGPVSDEKRKQRQTARSDRRLFRPMIEERQRIVASGRFTFQSLLNAQGRLLRPTNFQVT